jgi:hypothetical protein
VPDETSTQCDCQGHEHIADPYFVRYCYLCNCQSGPIDARSVYDLTDEEKEALRAPK